MRDAHWDLDYRRVLFRSAQQRADDAAPLVGPALGRRLRYPDGLQQADAARPWRGQQRLLAACRPGDGGLPAASGGGRPARGQPRRADPRSRGLRPDARGVHGDALTGFGSYIPQGYDGRRYIDVNGRPRDATNTAQRDPAERTET